MPSRILWDKQQETNDFSSFIWVFADDLWFCLGIQANFVKKLNGAIHNEPNKSLRWPKITIEHLVGFYGPSNGK